MCSLFHYSCSKIFIIPLFQSRKSHYSVIPEKPRPLFQYSTAKISIIPLFQSRKSHPRPVVSALSSRLSCCIRALSLSLLTEDTQVPLPYPYLTPPSLCVFCIYLFYFVFIPFIYYCLLLLLFSYASRTPRFVLS